VHVPKPFATENGNKFVIEHVHVFFQLVLSEYNPARPVFVSMMYVVMIIVNVPFSSRGDLMNSSPPTS
jgi:hypothetical protein